MSSLRGAEPVAGIPTAPEGTATSRSTAVAGILFIAGSATFVQVFIGLKLALLGVFFVAALVEALLRQRRLLYPQLVWFYVVVGILGLAWALVGLWRPANYFMGVTDALRLYVGWSVAFVVIFSLLRATTHLRIIHSGLIWGGLLIALVNGVGIADQLLGWGLVGTQVREAMYLSIGILEGYARINSINIGPLFLIVPYLLTLLFVPERRFGHPTLSLFTLFVCLALVAASGRRALWLVVVLTPFTVLAVSLLTRAFWLVPKGRRYALALCCAATSFAPLAISAMPGAEDAAVVEHVADAFSAEDERSIQSGYLISGWSRVPLIGSGFGAYAGYKRNELRPWSYELTYHRMLYNMGLIGTTVLIALFVFYFASVIHTARRDPDLAPSATAMVVGLLSLLMGAYSNPYLGSFDYLFLLGLLPYLATRPGVVAPRAS